MHRLPHHPKIHDPEGAHSKLRRKIDHLASDLSKIKTSVVTTLNPNRQFDASLMYTRMFYEMRPC
jgi:predicted translin family RNA/ssDNA-binding protein